MTNRQAILKLIRVLAAPHTLLILPMEIWGETWDGIRIHKSGYELFRISEIPLEDRNDYDGAEEFEEILEGSVLFDDDEIQIKGILEKILLG